MSYAVVISSLADNHSRLRSPYCSSYDFRFLIFEKDVKAKRLDGGAYALLYDRLQLMLGEKQRYGSQIGAGPDGLTVMLPLEDKSKVDQLRKEMGLEPLAQYVGRFGKDVKFLDEMDKAK